MSTDLSAAPARTTSASGRNDLLRSVFAPSSIALIGASDNPAKLITYRPIEYLRRFGYAGDIYPINPKYETVQGLPAYPSIRHTPHPPELVVVALPREHVLAALEECASVGTKVAIVYSSGFAEVPDGAGLQTAVTDLAQRTGMRVIGPNCQGVAALEAGAFPCFSTAFATDPPVTGRTAVISQSGAVAAMIYNAWIAVGGGVRYWASTGNEADVTVAQLARAAVEDPDVDQLLLYVESVRDGTVLADLAARAAELNKHVVLYRSTRTPHGWSAAGRHTGAGMAGNDRLDDQVTWGTHLLQADSLEELIALGQLTRAGKPLAGARLAVLSNSGGLGVMTADAATAAGFRLDDLTPESRRALAAVLPGFASVENPVDVTAQLLNDPALLAKALPVMLRDTAVDALVVALGAVGDGYDVEQIRRDVLHAHKESIKPIVVVWVGSRVDVRAELGQAGVPVYTSCGSAILALARHRDATVVAGTDSSPAPQQDVRIRPGPGAPGFADLFVGAHYRSGARTISGAEMASYGAAAGQTEDLDNLHVSLSAARAAGHRARVVSGLHTLTQLTVLGAELGLWENSSVVAGFRSVRFRSPVYEDDAIALSLTVEGLKPLERRPGGGLVTFAFVLGRPVGDDLEPVATGSVDYVFGPAAR